MAKKIGVGTVYMPQAAYGNIQRVLNSKRLSYGPFSQRFEALFSKIHGVQSSILVNSGTSALQVALHALKILYGWQDNDEVLVPALTFVATVNVVLENRLKPVFVDVDPDFFDLDPNQIERYLTRKTKAIIVAHLFGQSAPMDKIMALAKKHNLKVIEDSCETMFAKYHRRMVGSWGDISCFSTYSAHLVTTGVGGLVCTNNQKIATLCRSLANHGRSPQYLKLEDDDVTGAKLEAVVKNRFQFIYQGYSYRLSELEPALGLPQLKEYSQIIGPRFKNALYLNEKLAKLSTYLQLPQIREQATHDFMVYPLVLKSKKHKLTDLINYLEKNGIETRELLPLLNQPVYASLKIKIKDYPVAKLIETRGFYIGCHQDLKKSDLDYIVRNFYAYFKV